MTDIVQRLRRFLIRIRDTSGDLMAQIALGLDAQKELIEAKAYMRAIGWNVTGDLTTDIDALVTAWADAESRVGSLSASLAARDDE